MKLRVIASFRDISNFAIRHEVGDVIEVHDPDRISRLVNGGLCEEADKPQDEKPKANATSSKTTKCSKK